MAITQPVYNMQHLVGYWNSFNPQRNQLLDQLPARRKPFIKMDLDEFRNDKFCNVCPSYQRLGLDGPGWDFQSTVVRKVALPVFLSL